VAPSTLPTETLLLPSKSPTMHNDSWVDTPTHMPTGKPCADGTHPCDTHTSMCIVWQEAAEGTSEMYECVCLDGYVRNPHEPTSCQSLELAT
jgi:hypothetical protein